MNCIGLYKAPRHRSLAVLFVLLLLLPSSRADGACWVLRMQDCASSFGDCGLPFSFCITRQVGCPVAICALARTGEEGKTSCQYAVPVPCRTIWECELIEGNCNVSAVNTNYFTEGVLVGDPCTGN